MTQLRITNGFQAMTDLDLLGKVRFILAEMTGNTNFSTPDPTVASITTLADDFEKAINNAAAGGSYAKSVRESKKEVLVVAMHNLSSYVLFTSKGDRLIAESSGFTIAKDKSPQPAIEKPTGLVLSDGQNPGEVQLVFARVTGAKTYKYQITLDPLDETKWESTYGTVRKNLFTGLQSGKKYYVRVVALGTDQQVVYSDAVTRIAQ